jgi:hypothetical protein
MWPWAEKRRHVVNSEYGRIFCGRAAKNRAFRSNLFYRVAVKKDFRCNPLRGTVINVFLLRKKTHGLSQPATATTITSDGYDLKFPIPRSDPRTSSNIIGSYSSLAILCVYPVFRQ